MDGGWARGDGPPRRVFLPGLRADAREWARLDPHLDGAPALFLDLPDAGPALAGVAAAVLDRLPPSPVEVVGASFGGLVARALPPARVRAMTLIGTLPAPSPAARRAGRQGRAIRLLPRPLFAALYAERSDIEWLQDEPDGAWLARIPVPARDPTADRLLAIARWGLAERVTVPTRWLWGATDPWARWSVADVHAAGAEPVVVPGGHRPHLSHPAEVARWLFPDPPRSGPVRRTG